MMMRIAAVHLHSTQPEALARFYQAVLELEPKLDNDTAFVFAVADVDLIIMKHSKIYGSNRYPERMFFDLLVENVRSEFDRILALGATEMQKPYSFAYDDKIVTFATLADPDGNYFQLRAESAPVQDKQIEPD
jgi:catechol-2,3-dioxygenase